MLIIYLGFGGAPIGASLKFMRQGSVFLTGILIAIGAFPVIRAAIVYAEPFSKTG